MVLKEQVSRSNLGPVFFNNGDYTSGACNLFDEMPESDWRSPSRVLEVTIHRAYYPITEKVLHLVFDPFGEVEHVHVLGRSDHYLAQVVFKTKHAAAEAFGELHGRCVYTGCCQLDIKWELSQDCGTTMEKGQPNTTASMTPEFDVSGITSESDIMANASTVQLASATTAMSTLDGYISSEMLSVVTSASGTHKTTTAIAAAFDSVDVVVQPITVLDAMDCDIADKLHVLVASTQVQASLASAIPEDVITDTDAAAALALAIEMAANNITIDVLTKRSSEYSDPDIDVQTSASAANASLVLLGAVSTWPYVHIKTFSCIDQRENQNMLVLWMWPELPVGQVPWSPPLLPKMISTNGLSKRPTPWPSFQMFDDNSVMWFFSLPRKPPWLPQICHIFRWISDKEVLVLSTEIMMALIMSMRCANLTVVVGYIPEANHIYIQYSEGMLFFDQRCVVEADLFASWEGIESVQFCLYGELCPLITNSWLLPVGECELLGISLWIQILALMGRLLEQLEMLSKTLSDLKPWPPPEIHCTVLHLFIQGMQFKLWNILFYQRDQKLLHLIAISYKRQKRCGEMFMPQHIHAQVLPRYLLVEWDIKFMSARHAGSSSKISQPSEAFVHQEHVLEEQLQEISMLLFQFSQIEENYTVFSLSENARRSRPPGHILEVITGSQHVVLVNGNPFLVLIAYSKALRVCIGKGSAGLICKKSSESIHNKISTQCSRRYDSILITAGHQEIAHPWDPGGMLILTKASLNWLEGKPKLKEGEMLWPTSILEGTALWAVA